jgi:hypothetical protein
MSFVRERGNVIDYQIPITGNLKDPKFHFSNIINDLLRNIFVKPPTTPYRLEVRNVENEVEKNLSFKWPTRQSEISPAQKKFLDKISDFLKNTPDARLTVQPNNYGLKEKEYILFFEAKKKYYIDTRQNKNGDLTKEDEQNIDKMSVKDSLFMAYLNHHLKDSLIFTVQEKCYNIIDTNTVIKSYQKLLSDRKKNFEDIFDKKNVSKQINYLKDVSVIPYNGFSFYKIDYHGDYPKDLMKAYQEINELNNEPPRKKFKKERQMPVSKTAKQ